MALAHDRNGPGAIAAAARATGTEDAAPQKESTQSLQDARAFRSLPFGALAARVSAKSKQLKSQRKLWNLVKLPDILPTPGEVAEWLNAPVSKTGLPARVAGVRISPSPL